MVLLRASDSDIGIQHFYAEPCLPPLIEIMVLFVLIIVLYAIQNKYLIVAVLGFQKLISWDLSVMLPLFKKWKLDGGTGMSYPRGEAQVYLCISSFCFFYVYQYFFTTLMMRCSLTPVHSVGA